jgi:uncharacterized protein
MSAATETHRPANSSSLRRLVARHPVAAFLVITFTFAWTIMLPALFSEQGLGLLPISVPVEVIMTLSSVLGLALPAFLVTAATGGKDGVRDLLRRILRWRVGVHWYLLALFGVLVVTLLGAIPFLGVVPLEALAQDWSLLFTVFLPGVLIPLVLVNLWEETAWTGFMQHTLQERRGPLLASVIAAPFFALIHMPALFIVGWMAEERTPLSQFPAVLMQVGIIAVFAVFIRVVIMWLYNGTGGSVLIVALFHSAFNMTNGQKITPELLHFSETLATLIPVAVVAVLAVVLVMFTRGRLAYEPEHAAPRPAEAVGVAAQPKLQ